MKMEKTKKYFGIYFNQKIPKWDKKNTYDREVEIQFEGRAFFLKRKKDGHIEKIEIQKGHKIKKEGKYQIEFINAENQTYYLLLEIKTSWLLLIMLLLWIVGMINLFFVRPILAKNLPLAYFLDYINVSILPFSSQNLPTIDEKFPKQYDFDVAIKQKVSPIIDLKDTAYFQGNIKKKIAPGTQGSFVIGVNARKSIRDIKYHIKFQDIRHEKPANMLFMVRGDNQTYRTLQELEKNLTGILSKQCQKSIIIDWKWAYETGENDKIITQNDQIDTQDGEKLTTYQFKIKIITEEVI